MKRLNDRPVEAQREDIINRLRTIKGHIAGIEKMIEEGKNCDEIIAQIVAAKSSIHKVGLVIMENYAHECLSKPGDGDGIKAEQVEKVLEMVLNFSK